MSTGGTNRADRRVLDEAGGFRAMTGVMAIMLFLTLLAAALGLGTRQSATALERQLAGRLTVQVVDGSPVARDAVAARILAVLRALWPLTGGGPLAFPSNRHAHKPMSENAIGYLLNRAGYHGHHVPHGFRAAFSTIMNEWAEREGKEHDRKVIDLMLAHVPTARVEVAYNRAAYMPRRRELATVWADMLSDGLPAPVSLVERPAKETGMRSRRRIPQPVDLEFRFPSRMRQSSKVCFAR